MTPSLTWLTCGASVLILAVGCGATGQPGGTGQPSLPAAPALFADFTPTDYDHVTLRWHEAAPGMPKPLYYVARLAAIGLDFFPVARVPGEVTTTTIAVTGSDDPTLRFDLTAYASEDPASGARSNVVELHRAPGLRKST
jgi:hypothetical protein